MGVKLGERFDTSPNALNAIRLALAVEVVLWHAYALEGDTWIPAWAERFAGDIAVDGFFAISGFLIVRSWRRSNPRKYLTARAARIFPGLWVCVLLTALVLAPLVSNTAGISKARFVTWNWFAWPGLQPIGLSLGNVPHPYSWNGSLWSLRYELLCYLLVAICGSVVALRSRVVPWVGVAVAWALALAAARAGLPHWSMWVEGPRTMLMFGCGGLLYAYRDRVPVSRALAVASVVVVAAAVVTLPDYRIVAAPAVAYLMLWAGLELGRFPRMVLRTDLSYGTYIYGFPIQQALLAAGVGMAWPLFTTISLAAVLPVAALSWFVVERPCIRRARTGQMRAAWRAAKSESAQTVPAL